MAVSVLLLQRRRIMYHHSRILYLNFNCDMILRIMITLISNFSTTMLVINIIINYF